jgi:hypothetical protein
MKERRYVRKAKLYERHNTLPYRKSLRPGLLWLTLNLAPIFQCLSWNIFSQFYLPPQDVFAYPQRRIRLPQVEDHCYRQPAHRWRWGCQPYAPVALYSHGDSWYPFLSVASDLQENVSRNTHSLSQAACKHGGMPLPHKFYCEDVRYWYKQSFWPKISTVHKDAPTVPGDQ